VTLHYSHPPVLQRIQALRVVALNLGEKKQTTAVE
jgi:Zn-dependent protease with chaperone function